MIILFVDVASEYDKCLKQILKEIYFLQLWPQGMPYLLKSILKEILFAL